MIIIVHIYSFHRREFGLERFLPPSLMENMKRKELRRLIGHFMKLNQQMTGSSKMLTQLQVKTKNYFLFSLHPPISVTTNMYLHLRNQKLYCISGNIWSEGSHRKTTQKWSLVTYTKIKLKNENENRSVAEWIKLIELWEICLLVDLIVSLYW